MSKPVREALLNSATSIHAIMFDTYQNRKPTLSRLDKAIYQGALRTLAREHLPHKEAKDVITEFDQELADQREKAANARAARQNSQVQTGA